jgi:HPt (histidine-containing phosphotransfer) domain-containing protein
VDEQQQPSLAGALDLLWKKFLPEMEERVATLEAAAEAVTEDQLSNECRNAAVAAAHKLAGVLGTFGLTRGTDLARDLESSFSHPNRSDPAAAQRTAQIAAELRMIVAGRK